MKCLLRCQATYISSIAMEATVTAASVERIRSIAKYPFASKESSVKQPQRHCCAIGRLN